MVTSGPPCLPLGVLPQHPRRLLTVHQHPNARLFHYSCDWKDFKLVRCSFTICSTAAGHMEETTTMQRLMQVDNNYIYI